MGRFGEFTNVDLERFDVDLVVLDRFARHRMGQAGLGGGLAGWNVAQRKELKRCPAHARMALVVSSISSLWEGEDGVVAGGIE